MANRIYRLTGVPTLPWQIEDWPLDWLEAFDAYDVGVPEWRRKLKK